MERKLYVAGTIVIPVYFPVSSPSKEQALKQIMEALSNQTISVLDGEISTWNGRSYPLLARRMRVTWHDVVAEDDVI